MTADTFEAFLAQTRDRVGPEADPWTAAANDLFDELTARWELDLGDPVASSAFTVAAVRAGERPVLLRIAYPDGWFFDQVAALVAWDGAGAVGLIDHDPRGAMLLERPLPGDHLGEHDEEDEALSLAAGVLEKLWIPDPGGLQSVTDEVGEWVRTMPGRHHLAGRPFERELIDEAVATARDLLATQGQPVLLHGDLTLEHVVRGSDGFVALEPMPLIGERAFDVTGLLRSAPQILAADPVAGAARVQHRFDVLAGRLELERVRLQMWSFVVALDDTLWNFESRARAAGQARLKVTEMIRAIRV